MLRLCLVFLLALWVPACTSFLRPQGKRAELSPDEETRFVHFLDEVHATDLDRAPLQAAIAGLTRMVPAWDDLSPEHQERTAAWLRAASKRLQTDFPLRSGTLGAPHRAAAAQWIAWELKAIDWQDHQDLLSETAGAHRLPSRYLWEVARPQTAADWQHTVDLLNRLPDYLGQLEARLKARAALRTLPPRQVLMRARTSCLAWLAGRPFTTLSSVRSPWQAHAHDQLDASPLLGPTERNRIAEAIDRALAQSVGPAFQSLAATLDTLNSEAPEAIGVAARTDGPSWYAYRLERMAGEAIDPAEAHALGLAAVSRLRDRLRTWQQAAGSTESQTAWLQLLREGDDFARAGKAYWSESAQRWQQAAMERAAIELPALLEAKLTIYDGWSNFDGMTPPVTYHSLDRSLEIRPGDWVSIPELCVEALLAQAGIPGAHLRLAHSAPAKPLPDLLRTMDLPAWEAGWDLYATRLASDWKLYSGPEQELGQILVELWWAAQLVVDTGIHHEQWTQEESEQYLINNSAFRRSLCQSAVRDIIERPGARCAPTLGLAQILELRSQAEAALGSAFNAGAFHRALLLRSPLPIGPLRSRMAEWIESTLGKR